METNYNELPRSKLWGIKNLRTALVDHDKFFYSFVVVLVSEHIFE